MSLNFRAEFRVYLKHLSRKTQSFPCTYCGTLVLPKEYENHCTHYHTLNAKLCCVWCCGTESWRNGEKNRHSRHLINCFRRFYESRQVHTLTQPKSLNFSPTCPEVESFFNHSNSILQLLPPRAFQSVWPPEDLPTPPMTFQNENLNLAASYLQLYLETQNTHDWLHVMVKAVTMESFLQALDRDDGRTRVLEFWCWCDGGRDREDSLRQHRHMIVLSEGPRNRFEEAIWPQVRVDPQPRPNFPCKRIKKIACPLHLVNALGYLSRQRSRCNFSNKPGPLNENHFYICKTLPADYKLPLSTLWPGGLLKFLYQDKFQRAIPSRVAENPLFRAPGGTQWQQKIKHFYDLERGLVIPVEKRFEPTTEITFHFIYLTRNRKLHFRSNPENEILNQASWLQKQFELGNSFYDALGEETWIPRPRDQTRLNDIMSLIEKNRRIESEMTKLCEENEKLKRERQEFKRKWEEEREKLKLAYKLNNAYEKDIERRMEKLCSKCRKLS